VVSDRARSLLIALAVGLATAVAFAPAIQNGFVEWDDQIILTNNQNYRGLGWEQVRWMFSNVTMGHYVPVTWLTHGVDFVLWGMDPAGYHLSNIVYHAISAAIFSLVALRLIGAAAAFPPAALGAAAATSALFFALHPLRAESVAWVTERRDVVSGLFFLLTILWYLRARDVEGGARVRRHAVACLFYVLAIFSKSIVMTLPALLVLLDVHPLGRLTLDPRSWLRRDVWREKIPYVALGLLAALLGYYAQAANRFFTSGQDLPWSARPAMVAYSLWFYASKTFFPTGLSPLYELPPNAGLLHPRFLVPAIAVLAAIVALLLLRRRWPAGLATAAAYAIALAPVAGIVHSGYQLAHDRYSYLACLPWALLVGGGVGWVVRAAGRGQVTRRVAGLAVTAVAAWVLTLGALSWQQVQVWKDTHTLWSFALDAEPECTVCLYNHGAMLYNAGLHDLARERFERVMRVRPDRARAHANLGLVNAALGNLEQAATEYRAFIRRYPDDLESHNNLGVVLTRLGRQREAIVEFRFALGVEDNPVFRANLAMALLETGAPQEALAHAQRAADQKPDAVLTRLALGLVQARLGDVDAARREYDVLVRLDPPTAASLGALLITGW
jgi:tetratricopeptide (TPR) repeat protein